MPRDYTHQLRQWRVLRRGAHRSDPYRPVPARCLPIRVLRPGRGTDGNLSGDRPRLPAGATIGCGGRPEQRPGIRPGPSGPDKDHNPVLRRAVLLRRPGGRHRDLVTHASGRRRSLPALRRSAQFFVLGRSGRGQVPRPRAGPGVTTWPDRPPVPGRFAGGPHHRRRSTAGPGRIRHRRRGRRTRTSDVPGMDGHARLRHSARQRLRHRLHDARQRGAARGCRDGARRNLPRAAPIAIAVCAASALATAAWTVRSTSKRDPAMGTTAGGRT
jgi:hypothetical protein